MPVSVYIIASFAAFFAVVLAVPLWNCWCLKTGLMDDPGHRKIHAAPIPLSGGLAVFCGIATALGLLVLMIQYQFADKIVVQQLAHGVTKRFWLSASVFGGMFAMLVLGYVDDRHELKPHVKFSAQLAIALATAASGIRITLFVDNVLFSYFVTVLWILTVTNAFNFMDNMNGLCTGLGIIASGWIAAGAIVHNYYLVGIMALIMGSALLGFLPYNYPKAKAFLGDSGSHLIGYMMAVLAIIPHYYSIRHPNPWAVLCPLLILAVPLADLVWVVILRHRLGRPFYVGDNNHWSHRLVKKGLSQTASVALIWLAAFLCGSITVWLW